MKKAPFYMCDDHDNAQNAMRLYAEKIRQKLEEEGLLDEDCDSDDSENLNQAVDDEHLIRQPDAVITPPKTPSPPPDSVLGKFCISAGFSPVSPVFFIFRTPCTGSTNTTPARPHACGSLTLHYKHQR